MSQQTLFRYCRVIMALGLILAFLNIFKTYFRSMDTEQAKIKTILRVVQPKRTFVRTLVDKKKTHICDIRIPNLNA